MSDEKCIFDFSGEAVERRLREGRKAAEQVQNKTAPKTGYLDTQLFPDKKEPGAYEKSYSFPDPHPSKKKLRAKVRNASDV